MSKALLCYNSPFFERAFNGDFKEAREQKMELHDFSAETFQLAVQVCAKSHAPSLDNLGLGSHDVLPECFLWLSDIESFDKEAR